MNPSLILTAFLVFSAVICATLAVALGWEALRSWLSRRQVAKRLEPVLREVSHVGNAASDELVRDFKGEESFWADLANSLPGRDPVEALIRESRVDWRPETFFFLTAGLALGLAAPILVLTGNLIFAAMGALAGAVAPYLYLRRKRALRLKAFEEEFPETIDLLTRAIRAGHPLAAGMRMVAEEGPPTVAAEFRQTFEEQRFGLPFAEALHGMVDRVNLVDVRIFTIAVLIQREVGGNLAEILDNLAETIRGRFYIRRQLRTYTAQGRMSGYVLAALPPVVALGTFAIDPGYASLLVETSIGKLLIATALTLQFLGVLWIRKIINIDI